MTKDEILKKYNAQAVEDTADDTSTKEGILRKYNASPDMQTSDNPLYNQSTSGLSQSQIYNAASQIPANQQLQQAHPFGYKVAESISQSPVFSRALQAITPGDSRIGRLDKGLVNQLQSGYPSLIPSGVGGALQAGYDVSRSLANLPSDVINALTGSNLPTVPDVDASKYGNQAAINQGMFQASDLYGSLEAGGELFNLAEKIPGLAGRGLATLAGKGFAVGSAGYENSPGGRIGGGTIGALMAPLEGLSDKNISDHIASVYKPVKDAISKGYEDTLSAADSVFKDSSVPQLLAKTMVPVSDKEVALIKKLPGGSKYTESLKNAMSNSTFQNMHSAQSDLGALLRNNSDFDKLSSRQKEATYLTQDVQDRLQKSISSHMSELVNPDLANQYSQLSQQFATKVAPFKNVGIDNYIAKPTADNAKSLVKNIKQSSTQVEKGKTGFVAATEQQLPGLKRDLLAQSILRKLVPAGSLLGAAYTSKKLFGQSPTSGSNYNNSGQ